MSANETSDDVVRLLEECLEAKEQGGDGAVEALLASRPDLSDAVRTRIEALSRAGLLEAGEESELPERMGDFRLIERLGSGGMGVVYLAEQESLGRRVALKLVHPEHLFFPGSRERFRREVEAIARLEHEGIAPVYVVGEEGGVPYFAMEYVAGASLEQVLSALRGRRPETLRSTDLLAAIPGRDASSDSTLPDSWVDLCFAIAAQISEAMKHAHERGVLHRDIKPSNIMLTPSGRVRLLDFGLARSEGDVRITRSGSVLGSLPYMAPEQVRGETRRIGPATDVYALGVTLYELLTLRPAYWSETTERTRQRVLDGTPVAIERLNSAVPWDAETVCRTAMDFDPMRRYPTMAAMAEDLGRFLRREPILARRPGGLFRLRRWVQRRPALTTGLVLGALIAVGGPIAYAVQADAARVEITQAYDAEAQQRVRAQKGLDVAIAAIDEMLTAATDQQLERSPRGDEVRRRMLESTRTMSEELLESEGAKAGITERVASVQRKLAKLHMQLGSPVEAEQAARAAVATADRLAPAAPNRLEMAIAAEVALIGILGEVQKVDEAIERANVLLDELGSSEWADQADVDRQIWVGTVWQVLGELRMKHRDIDGSVEASRKAIAAFEIVAANEPTPSTLDRLAHVLEAVAYVGGFHDREPGYAALFERAIKLRQQRLEESPGDPGVRFGLGKALGQWAHVDVRKSEPFAIERTKQAVEVLTRVADDFPLRSSYTHGALANIYRLGYLLARDNQLEAGIAELRAGLERAQAAAARLPAVMRMTYHVAVLSSSLAYELGQADRAAEAQPLWQTSLQAWTTLIGRPEPEPQYLIQVGAFYDNWARFEFDQANLDRSEELAEQACAYHRLAHQRTGLPLMVERQGKSLVLLARIETVRGNHAAAVALLERAVREGRAPRELLIKSEFGPLAEREDYSALLESVPR